MPETVGTGGLQKQLRTVGRKKVFEDGSVCGRRGNGRWGEHDQVVIKREREKQIRGKIDGDTSGRQTETHPGTWPMHVKVRDR